MFWAHSTTTEYIRADTQKYRQKLKLEKPKTHCVRVWDRDSAEALKWCFECSDWQVFFDSCSDNSDEFTDTVNPNSILWSSVQHSPLTAWVVGWTWVDDSVVKKQLFKLKLLLGTTLCKKVLIQSSSNFAWLLQKWSFLSRKLICWRWDLLHLWRIKKTNCNLRFWHTCDLETR